MGAHTTQEPEQDTGYDAARYEVDPEYRAFIDGVEALVQAWREGYGEAPAA